MADGGYPPTSNISWVKNNRIISTTSAEQLTINVTAGLLSFGRYVCLVNNSAVIQQKSLLIKQKGANYSCTYKQGTVNSAYVVCIEYFLFSSGELQVEVNLNTIGRCSNLNVSSTVCILVCIGISCMQITQNITFVE